MSKKCFKIVGFLEANNLGRGVFGRIIYHWFDGYIVVNDENVFEGYLEPRPPSLDRKLRFVTGVYVEKDERLSFYQLSDFQSHSPILYVFPIIRKFRSECGISKNGKWAVFDMDGVTLGDKGEAKIQLDTDTFDQDLLNKIQEVKENILKGNRVNNDYISKVGKLFEVFDTKL